MKLAPLLLAFPCLGLPAQRETSIFGDPIFVNDKRVSDDEIKLALIYGPCRQALELRKTGLLIETEIARQATAGTTSAVLHARYAVTDEQFEADYQVEVGEFKQAYPSLDVGAEICRAYRSVDWYRDFLRQQMLFDRVFLPEDPAAWPATTVDAIRADPGGGQELLRDARNKYEERLESTGKLPREDPLYMTFLRQIVNDTVLGAITFKTHRNGIDAKLALWADTNGDGKPELAVPIDEIWDKVSDVVSDTDIQEAKQWCVTSSATRERLAQDAALLSADAREQVWADLESTAANSGFSIESLAVVTLHFPSTESYCEYYELLKGFERLITPKLADGPRGELAPALAAYLPRANQSMGLGMVDCEVLLVSAMDIPRFSWKKDGWFEARRKAQRLREEYDKNPTPACWSRLVDEHSEYWDPPPNEHANGGSSDIIRKHSGRFGERPRSLLMQCVDESAYTEWVTGECITDRIFFDQAENTVAGPFRGPLGWYLTRVQKRTPSSRSLDLGEPNHRLALKDDYLRSAFIQYSKEAVAQAHVRGFQPL